MPSELQPFLISEFKSGINTYLQPWIRPADAFQPLENAYIYRGVVNKRAGYVQFGNTVPDGKPIMGIMRYINESTGAQSLVIATTVNLYLYDPGTGNYNTVTSPPTFTGNITQFFNWTNWQASAGATSFLYFVNNKDNIGTFDGTTYAALVPVIDGAGETITTALDVQVYKQRLLVIRPTLSIDGVQNQSIYWSKQQNPAQGIGDTNWRVDIAGNGGFLAAPTGDIIQSTEFIRDVLVVFFTNSTWIFRFTGNQSDPFRWDKVNNSKSTNAPYAAVNYDERCTSIGNTGLIACDGVNVQRYDIPIIDYYETNFSEQYYGQSFSQRYDNLNQAWTLYVSNDPENQFPLVGSVAPGSDSALVYNFLENTWATYSWSIPLTCLGLYYAQTGTTWASLSISPADEWANFEQAWNATGGQKGAPILLAGDTTGHVYQMDTGLSDNGTPINVDIVTTRWNPIMKLGQKTQFCYIDIYYRIISSAISVTLDFYVDNTTDTEPATTRTLTLDGPVGSGYAFKRVYINLIGEFIQMEIDPDENANLQFVGFIIWARPAGRLTPF